MRRVAQWIAAACLFAGTATATEHVVEHAIPRGAGRGAWPRNTGLNGSMPAIVSSTVGSSGTSEALATR